MLRVCYCEDEDAQIEEMQRAFLEWPGQVQLQIYRSAEALLFDAQEEGYPFDLLILDIRLGRMNGMELAKEVRRRDAAVWIAFLTNDPEYVFAGYEVAAIRYLMKPLNRGALYSLLKELEGQQKKEKPYWIFSANGEKIKLDVNEVWYVEAVGHYIRIVTEHKIMEIKKSLQEARRELPEQQFISPHRSYLVNLRYIGRINRESCILDNGQQIPISRGRYRDVNQAFIETFSNDR